MSEGPQVKLTTERLTQYLAGNVIADCRVNRPNLCEFAEGVGGRTVERVWCKGKHIFMDFGRGLFLHNHLLMRGSWRKEHGRLLLLATELWLALEVENITVCNYRGQMLRMLDADQVEVQLGSVGPDVMGAGCASRDIAAALAQSAQPAGEALLDQSLLSGVGNVAKSEALFLARIHPQVRPCELRESDLARLADSIRQVMWDSYHGGGRWTHRVYRRAGQKCVICGSTLRMVRQGRASRSTYFCPACQTM